MLQDLLTLFTQTSSQSLAPTTHADDHLLDLEVGKFQSITNSTSLHTKPSPVPSTLSNLISTNPNKTNQEFDLRPPTIDESNILHVEYIPLDIAHRSLHATTSMYNDAKSRYERKICQLSQQHSALAEKMKLHYETYIMDLKSKALEHFLTHKRLREEKEAEHVIVTAKLQAQLQTLRHHLISYVKLNEAADENVLELTAKLRQQCAEETKLRANLDQYIIASTCNSTVEAIIHSIELTHLAALHNSKELQTRAKLQKAELDKFKEAELRDQVLASHITSRNAEYVKFQIQFDRASDEYAKAKEEWKSQEHELNRRCEENQLKLAECETRFAIRLAVCEKEWVAKEERWMSQHCKRIECFENELADKRTEIERLVQLYAKQEKELERAEHIEQERDQQRLQHDAHESVTTINQIVTPNISETEISNVHSTAVEPTTGPQRSAEQIAIITNLEDQLLSTEAALATREDELRQATKKMEELQCSFNQLLVEKRSDVLRLMEGQLSAAREEMTNLVHSGAAAKAEITRLQARCQELQIRADMLESELEERKRNESVTEPLTTEQVQGHLMAQIELHRMEVLRQGRSATDGWSAAAGAEQQLTVQGDREYRRGLAEGQEVRNAEWAALNRALEEKDEHLSKLTAEMLLLSQERQRNEELLKEVREELNQAQEDAADAIASFATSIAFASNNGLGNNGSSAQPVAGNNNVLMPSATEWKSMQSTLDAAQSEVVQLSERCTAAEARARLLTEKAILYEKLLVQLDDTRPTKASNAHSSPPLSQVTAPHTSFVDAMMTQNTKAKPRNTNSESNEEYVAAVYKSVKNSLSKGSALWRSNKREECGQLYTSVLEELVKNAGAAHTNSMTEDSAGAYSSSHDSVYVCTTTCAAVLGCMASDAILASRALTRTKATPSLRRALEGIATHCECQFHSGSMPASDSTTISRRHSTSTVNSLNNNVSRDTSPTRRSSVASVVSMDTNLSQASETSRASFVCTTYVQPVQVPSTESVEAEPLQCPATLNISDTLVNQLRDQLREKEAQLRELQEQILRDGAAALSIENEFDENLVGENEVDKGTNETKDPEDGNLQCASNGIVNLPSSSSSSLLRRARSAERKLELLVKQMQTQPNPSLQHAPNPNTALELRKSQRRVKELENQLLQFQQAKNGYSTSNGAGVSAGTNVDLKSVAQMERIHTAKLTEVENRYKKEKSMLESRVRNAEEQVALFKANAGVLPTITGERDELKKRVREQESQLRDMESLRVVAGRVEQVEGQLKEKCIAIATLEEAFKKETALRKKYKNELEDLKGAIRVYARCRPMAKYELERGCAKAVSLVSDTGVRVMTGRGEKEFEFDAAFGPESTQEAVFEDTRRLVESCLDGYNVCLFAYGQTGSGKTFTMTGTANMPGLTPAAIRELFRLKTEKSQCTVNISTYFVELYNDTLVDLYLQLERKSNGHGNKMNLGEVPKLEIKMDERKMVSIKNVVVKTVESAGELMDLFTLGNAERHVGATKMNAESSRSHSIFAIMIESCDRTTKKTSFGKLSLVDLAGSERADKTGAGAERLKEAQSINKSLSALGDVIAALSEGASFVPYRNNKLTQLMQDSLGGNAKTLMFVNFSPADYNCDETVSSLTYAARVKKITNNASKQAESEEVARLKQIIKRLQGADGGAVELEIEHDIHQNQFGPVEEIPKSFSSNSDVEA